MLRTTQATSPPLDRQAGAQSAGWPVRDESEGNVVDLSQHDGGEGFSTSVLLVMVRDGCDDVCACTGACSPVASFPNEYIVRVWSNNP
jgi:hypothetical protein